MNLIPVESVPNRPYHPLQDMIEEFVNGKADIVRVDLSEKDYKSAQSAYKSIWVAVKKSRRNVKVSLRGDQVFLSKVKN